MPESEAHPQAQVADMEMMASVASLTFGNRTRKLAPDLYRRYLVIVLEGMRADRGRSTKLPVAALTVEETHVTLQP